MASENLDGEYGELEQSLLRQKRESVIHDIANYARVLKRRELLSQKFISGKVGVELAGYEAGRSADRRPSSRRGGRLRKSL